MTDFVPLSAAQAREKVNSDQRFAAVIEAKDRFKGLRGSLVWKEDRGTVVLARSYYDGAGVRRQKIEGKKGPETEAVKRQWDEARERRGGASGRFPKVWRRSNASTALSGSAVFRC